LLVDFIIAVLEKNPMTSPKVAINPLLLQGIFLLLFLFFLLPYFLIVCDALIVA